MSDHDPIEDALRKLRPAELESSLMARLSAARPRNEIAAQKSTLRDVLMRWLLPLTASACVAVGTFFFLEHNRAHDPHNADADSTAATGTPMPVESEDYLVSARPLGIVVAPNQQPYRIMDVEWLEHETVRTGADGRAHHTATTRRDVIPVALEIY